MYIDSKYVGKSYRMPNFEGTPKSEKQKPEWFKAVSEWIYSQHVNDKTAIPASYAQHFELMRLYGAGKQPGNFYKEKLSGDTTSTSTTSTLRSDRNEKKKGWDNIDFDSIVSIMPLLKSILISTLKSSDYDISCDAIDPHSGSREEDRMWRKWMKREDGAALQELARQFDIPVEVDDIMPDDFQDLKQIRAEGGFKVEHAIEIEELIKFTEQISKWDEQLHEDIINEALDNGYICGYEDFCQETKTSQWNYIQPEYIIKQYSRTKKFDDSDYEGVQLDYSISYMKSIFPGKGDDFWLAISDKFKSYSGIETPYVSDIRTSNYSNQYYGESYDSQRVPVIMFRWNDVEYEEYVKFKTKNNEDRILQYNEKEKYASKQKKYTNRRRVSYTCKWVPGTDLIFDEKQFPNQPIKNTRPMSFIKIYQFPYQPITWRLKPILDQLQINWLKFQNALNISLAGGIAINMSMIKEAADMLKGDELGMIRLIFERGFLPFTHNPLIRQGGGAVSPVQELPNNVLSSLKDYIAVIEQMLILVEKFTGLSPIALGAAPLQDQPVGTSELSYASTLKSLAHIVMGCGVLKQELAEYSSERIRILLEDEEVRKVYESIIGEEGVYIIRKARKQNAQYGYKLIARPSEELKKAIIEQANISNQKYLNQQPGITEGERTKIIEMFEAGVNLKMIGRYMDAWTKKDEKRKHQMKLEAEQAQGKQLQDLDNVQTENYRKKKLVDLSYESELKKLQGNIDVEKIVVQEDEKRKTEEVKKNQEQEKPSKV